MGNEEYNIVECHCLDSTKAPAILPTIAFVLWLQRHQVKKQIVS